MKKPSKAQIWRDNLESQSKRLKKKDIKALLATRIISITEIGKGKNKQVVVIGLNYSDRQIRIVNNNEMDCLNDLATLNGYTLED